MAVTFEDWVRGDETVGIMINDNKVCDADTGETGLALLSYAEAIQVRDELLRRYPLEKAETPKPESRVLGDGSHGALVGGGPAMGYIHCEFGRPFIGSGGACAEVPAPGEAEEDNLSPDSIEPVSQEVQDRINMQRGTDQARKTELPPSLADAKADGVGLWCESVAKATAAAYDEEKLLTLLAKQFLKNEQLSKRVAALESALKALIGE